ncbi:hypothetical protein AAEO50_12325 [Rossellomorea oryzaecorticis]|uniref:Uncharacterized protein n=1 Tax=Rossellomorea oryzaecorticis TaxID=1396505 RepID=A0ABU9KAL0_9BACI
MKFGVTGMRDIGVNLLGAAIFSFVLTGYATSGSKSEDTSDIVLGLFFAVGFFVFFSWLFIKFNFFGVFFE